MANGSRKGAVIGRIVTQAKHGKSAPRRRNPLTGYMKPGLLVTQDDHSWRSFALLGWPRGFSPTDAPPERNEWTPHHRLW